MAKNLTLKAIIELKDNLSAGLSKAASGVKSFAKGIFSNLMNIKAGFEMVRGAATKLYSVLETSLKFETQTRQFKMLVGGMEEARRHMQMLKELGDTPPFSLDEFAAASRAMLVMSEGALGYKKSLELVGDAAAATGQPLEGLAHSIGRAYGVIRDGEPIQRATMQLVNMGVITPEVAAKLEAMQSAGASNIEIWQTLEKQLGRFNGAMKETEETGEGMIGALGSQWDNAKRTFGDAFLDQAKDGIGALTKAIESLVKDGTLALWAEKASAAIAGIISAVGKLHGLLNDEGSGAKKDAFDRSRGQTNLLQHAWNLPMLAGGMLNGVVGMARGDGFRDSRDLFLARMGTGRLSDAAARRYSGRHGWTNDVRDVWDEVDSKSKDKHAKQQAMESAAKEQETRDAEVAEEERIAQQMADGQKKIDAKRAEEAKKLLEEEEAKRLEALQKEADARRALEAQLAAERQRLLGIELDQRITGVREEVAAQSKAQQDAQGRLSAAKAQSQQAWGWYRNKDSLKAQLEEEKANADAERQFAKDAASLTRRGGWRDAKNLSLEDEAVRRVVLAREEEKAASATLKAIEENTAELAEKFDELMRMKGGG